MSIPDFQTLMKPVLKFAAQAEERKLRETYPAMADLFQLSQEEREQMIPSGRVRLFHNRVAWAVTYLKKAELLAPRRRGVYAITALGKKALEDAPDRITLSYLMRFEAFRAFRNQRNGPTKEDEKVSVESSTVPVLDEDDRTPEEVFEASWKAIRENLETEVLDQIKQVSPAFFEQLVVDVLVSMGYGGERLGAARAVGQSGDGGIDGIIDEDPLGLDVIYLQAKRWEGMIGAPRSKSLPARFRGSVPRRVSSLPPRVSPARPASMRL